MIKQKLINELIKCNKNLIKIMLFLFHHFLRT